MERFAKVTISLPAELLAYVDRKQRESHVSRSELVRRAIERLRREERERELDEQFVRGWRERPETEDEFGWVEQASREALAELPWDEKKGDDEPRRDLVGKTSRAVGAPPRPARRAG